MYDAKKHLIEILDYYKMKLLNDGCTMDEINETTKLLEQNMKVSGTIKNFADFYGVPESVVRTNIARKMIDKPKRKVLYPFHKFIKIVPEKWRNFDR